MSRATSGRRRDHSGRTAVAAGLVLTSSARDARVDQSFDLIIGITELGEDFLGVLAESRRVAPNARGGVCQGGGEAGEAHAAAGQAGMWELLDHFALQDLRIGEDLIDGIDRAGR